MTTLNRRLALLMAVAAIAVAGLLTLLGPLARATASAEPLLSTAAAPALPTGAALGSSESASFTAISCTAPGECEAGGSYRDAAGGQLAMVDAEANGSWAPPQSIALGRAETPAHAAAAITSISCPAQGFCVAVGSDRASGNGTLLVTQQNGAWATATTLPSVAGEISGGGALDSVSCPSVGNCVAVGTSTTRSGLVEPTIATETDGSWAAPVVMATPAGDDERLPTSLSVSCPAVGDCVVAGTDYPSSGPELPMLIIESGGSWQPAQALGALGGALADGNQGISLGAIECAAVGQCTAVGDAQTAGGPSGFALIDSGGSFSEVGLPFPAGAAGYLSATPGIGLDAVACAQPDACLAAGAYPTGGTSAAPQAAPMAAAQAGGGWSAPVPLAAPANAAPNAGPAVVRALSCPAAGACAGAGAYRTAGGAQIPMLVSPVPPLMVTSTSLPPAPAGRPYSVQLQAAGAAGPLSWTVSAGALPVGLSLDAATGVISGTPRFSQRSSFTITVADGGPPAQTASAALSIRVSVQGPPTPRISVVRITSHRASVAGRRVRGRCAAPTRQDRHHHPCRRAARVSLRVHLNIGASVRLSAVRLLRGRWVRHGLVLHCRPVSHRNRRHRPCTRSERVAGHDTLRLGAGTDVIRWRAVVGHHALRAGRYRLRLVPSFGHERGRAVTVRVRISG